jgi:hypothetical protein
MACQTAPAVPTLPPTPANTATQAPPTLTRTPTNTATVSLPTRTFTPAATATPTPPPGPPAEVIDLLAQNIQSGKWSEGQALVNVLSYAAGQKTAQEVFGSQSVRIEELSGIMAQTRQYLKNNPNAPEKKQLETLTAILVPDVKRILPYARPEGSASAGQIVPVAYHLPAPRQDVVCQTIIDDGFPPPKPGQTPPVCVLYKQFTVLGKTYRIFYPKDMATSGATTANLAWTADALKTAAETYQALEGKTISDTDLVFATAPINKTKEGTEIAATAALSSDQICQIAVYKNVATQPEAPYKQLIAHELFHCYQQAFMKTADTPAYSKTKWWIEGSAQYFSNVVYPKANAEMGFAAAMDKRSVKESLFDLSYENDFFFQYMGNQITPLGVLKVLTAFPASGEPTAYLNAMNASIPDFETFFHEFGQAYLDGAIQDTGGGTAPFAPLPGDAVTMQDGGTQPLDTKPFTITRYRVIYEKGKYTQTETKTGKGMDTARPRDTVGTWAALPGEVGANCGKRAFVMLVTSVTPNNKYIVTIHYNKDKNADETECDACLIGSWRLDSNSFSNYMASVLKPPVAHILGSADMTLTFTLDSIMQADIGKLSDLSALPQSDLSGGTVTTTIAIEVEGESTAEYYTKAGVIYTGNGHSALNVGIKINGQDMGSNGVDSGGWNFMALTNHYTCVKDTLTYTPQISGASPLQFWRLK